MSECICEGNFRKIVNENEHLFGKTFSTRDGKEYIFLGILWGEDDLYYSMYKDGDVKLLSCVSDLVGWEFKLIKQIKKSP